jgi:hypothetical protein
MSKLQQMIADKQKAMAAKKGRSKTFKPGGGKTRIRILPGWNADNPEQFWHDYGMHFVKNDKGALDAVYLCVESTFGKECPICQAIGQGIKSSNDDEQIKLLKQANAAQRYLVNVLVLSDAAKKDEPQIMECGILVFEAICEVIAEYGDITQLSGGTDLVINREGTGQYDTKYTVLPAPKSVTVPPATAARVHNLDEYVAQENDAGRTKAITAVGRAAGLLLADETASDYSAPAIEAPSKSDDMGSVMDSDIDDGEIVPEEASLSSVESATDDLDDDDLDSLLADLG